MGDFQYENKDGTLLVSHRKALSHNMPASHFHSTYEIFYLMSGKREFFIKDRTMVINEGDVIIISPNILHRTTNTETPQHERLIINIHESNMASANGTYIDTLQPLFEQEYIIIKCSLQDMLSIEALSKRIIEEIQAKKQASRCMRRLWFCSCFWFAAGILDKTASSP